MVDFSFLLGCDTTRHNERRDESGKELNLSKNLLTNMSWRNQAFATSELQSKSQSKASVASLMKKEKKSGNSRRFAVVQYLQHVPNHTEVSIDQIKENTEVDLLADKALLDEISSNKKISVTGEGENLKFAYKARHSNINDKRSLFEMIKRRWAQGKYGLPYTEVEDCYPTIMEDIASMVNGCEIIAVKNNEFNKLILYPRDFNFLTILGMGKVTGHCANRDSIVSVTGNLMDEIRHGDAVLLGNAKESYRISTMQRGKTNDSWPKGAILSASTTKDTPENTLKRYAESLTPDSIPLHRPIEYGWEQCRAKLSQKPAIIQHLMSKKGFADKSELYDFLQQDAQFRQTVIEQYPELVSFAGPLFKHGCTNDIKKLWKNSAKNWPADRCMQLQIRCALTHPCFCFHMSLFSDLHYRWR